MTASILITGAPGTVGTPLVQQLREQDVAVRVGARNVERARDVLGHGLDIVRFDFTDPQTYRQTFAGIERMFLVRPPALANVARDIAPAVYAASGAGVSHIVFLSLQGVEKNRVVPHRKIEDLIRSLGVAYTFLRCGFFMQNLSTTHRAEIRDHNTIAVPVGQAKTSFIDARDIAAVAVRALTEDSHANQAYTLTGGEALSYTAVADIMSAVLQRPIYYTNPSALRFLWQQLAHRQPPGYALVVTALYTITRFGNASQVAPDVERLLGRKPITLRQFVEDHAAVWQPRQDVSSNHDQAH
jgi:uncharacterized protein YbjT (DUF2867 family)